MGVLFVLAPFVPRLSREWHVGRLMQRAGRGGPVLTGAAFALAWTPCTGPTLGAIITAAGRLGLGRPRRVPARRLLRGPGRAVPDHRAGVRHRHLGAAVVKRHYPVVIGAGGVVLIGMGVLIWTGEFTQLNITVNHWLQSLGLPDFNSDT